MRSVGLGLRVKTIGCLGPYHIAETPTQTAGIALQGGSTLLVVQSNNCVAHGS
jgi:hypothetical protein